MTYRVRVPVLLHRSRGQGRFILGVIAAGEYPSGSRYGRRHRAQVRCPNALPIPVARVSDGKHARDEPVPRFGR